MAETPVGEHPATGGPRRIHESAAARAKAARERKRATAKPSDLGPPEPVPPELAPSALAVTLQQLVVAADRLSDEGAAVAARVEAAVAGIGNPDAVASALDACRAAAQETVAVAEARAADADCRRVQAERDAENARVAAAEAVEAADAFDARLQEVEAWAEAAQDGWAAEQAARAQDAHAHADNLQHLEAEHAQTIEALRDAHMQGVAELGRQHEAETKQLQAEHAAHVEQVRNDYRDQLAVEVRRTGDEAVARERAERSVEGLTSELAAVRAELDGVKAAVPGLVETAREETRQALTMQHLAELAACEARREGEVAELAGRLRGCQAELAATQRQVTQLAGRQDPAEE